jgi:soluble P-type ATPase
MARRAARIDANQTEIVSTLRSVGARVQSLAAVGDGVADLLVGYRGDLYLIECKDGDKPPSRRKLTEAQEAWHAEWDGYVHLVTCVDEALDALHPKA